MHTVTTEGDIKDPMPLFLGLSVQRQALKANSSIVVSDSDRDSLTSNDSHPTPPQANPLPIVSHDNNMFESSTKLSRAYKKVALYPLHRSGLRSSSELLKKFKFQFRNSKEDFE